MRISRLARIHNLSVQELTSFLETLDPPLKSVHPNAKLEDETINLVLNHFDLEVIKETPQEDQIIIETPSSDHEEPIVDVINEVENEVQSNETLEIELTKTPEEEIAILEGDLVNEADSLKESVSLAQKKSQEVEEEEVSVAEEETILSDQLIELLDSEEPPEDLDKIKLIKAPKKKLSGLKVLDKIEIPEEPKKKSKEQEEEEKPRLQLTPEEKAERVRKREEYKEKRRLEAKRKQEEYEARKERRKKEQEERRLKAEREKHYQEQLTRQKTQHATRKIRKVTPTKETSRTETSTPQPKTILGKFWRWLNT